jgi:hypothetical protein
MQMIDVLKRLADLDKGNPNVVNPMVAETALIDEMITEGKNIELPNLPEPGLSDLKALSGVKTKLTESTIAECGMMPMGAPMPPTMPASLNMSAGNAGEIVAMMRGIMDLAKGDVPSQSMMPTMGAPMPKMMGDLDHDGDHDMADHGMEKDNDVLTGGPAVSGPTFGDDGGAVDDSGADELADMMKKIRTGEPVKITTDMPVKVTSDEPIKGTTDKLNKVSGDGPSVGDEENEEYDNSPKPVTKGHGDGNDFANIINKVRSADMTTTPANSGSNPMPDKKKEEAVDPLSAFESKLMNDYKKFVEEAEQKTMSRAAKGMMKYGKKGMKALADAGREGKDLEPVRAKYNKYDEASHQSATTMKHVKNPTAGEKKAAKDIKPGIKGYADRVAMLKSAEADGRLK